MANNEYDQILEGDAAGGGNEFDSVLQADQDQKRSALKQSMFVAAPVDADREAQVQRLARETKLPVDVVNRTFESLQQKKKVADTDYDGIIENSPGLAGWLEDPNNAKLAHDELPALQKMEDTVRERGFLESMYESLGKGANQMAANAARIPGLAFDAIIRRKTFGLIGKDDFPVENEPAKFFENTADSFHTPDLDTSIIQSIRDGDYKKAGRGAAAQFVTNAPNQAAIIVASFFGGPAAGLSLAGLSSASGKYQENLDAGVDPRQAMGNAFLTGGIEAGFENLGTLGILKKWEGAISKQYGKEISREFFKDFGKTLAYSVAAEGNEEALTSMAQDFSDYVTGINPNALVGMGDRAANAFISGGISGGGLTAPAGVAAGLSRASKSSQAGMNRDFYLALGSSAEATKLRERMPEAQRALVEKMTAGTPVENVYISPEALEEYFQTGKGKPANIMQELGLLNEYSEAKETGQDIKIPLAKWVEKFVGTEHYQGLQNDIKFDPSQLTVNELKNSKEEVEAADESAQEDAKEESADPLLEIQGTVAAQLEASGYSPSAAKANAEQMASRYKTRAEILGLDPLQLYKEEGAEIGSLDSTAVAPEQSQSFNQPADVRTELQTELALPEQMEVLSFEDLQLPIDAKELRKSALEFAKLPENRGAIVNAHTGREIQISSEGLKKSANYSVRGDQALALRNIPALVESAVWVRSENDRGGDKNVRFNHYYAPFESKGRQYVAKITAKETLSGKNSGRQTFYTLHTHEIKKPAGGASEPSAGVGSGNTPDGPSKVVSKSDLLEAVNAAREVTEYFQGETDKAGRFVVTGGGVRIEIGAKADLSTFIHETGHLYLHEMGRDVSRLKQFEPEVLTDRQRKFLADADVVLKWLGVNDFSEIKKDQHEQFARGFEAYHFEGKAPSAKLREAFARFRSWLVAIYRQIKNLDVELSDDVRGVFDRMLATEEEIAAMRAQEKMQPLFPDPRLIGLNDSESLKYLNAVESAKIAAEEELTSKLITEMQRDETAWWNEEKAKVEAEVTKEVDARPEILALAVLQRGKMPDGSPLPTEGEGVIPPMKLSKEAIASSYGNEVLESLPRPYVYSRTGGIHPDTAADTLGFNSGKELLDAIINAQPRDMMIEQQTQERMIERFGDLLHHRDSMKEEALRALHNEERGKLLKMELDFLIRDNLPVFKKTVKRVAKKVPSTEAVKAQAAEIINSKSVRDISPIVYQRAEVKAAEEAVDALMKGDQDRAFDAKKREMLNHELYRAAVNAREEIDKTVDYMKKFRKETKRAQLGRTDYLEQIDNLLARFEFARVPESVLAARKKNLVQWIQEMSANGEALGEEVFAPDFLKNEMFRKNYKDLSFEEIIGIRDTVKQIEHMAIQQDKVLTSEKKERWSDVKDQLLASLRGNLKKKPPRPYTKSGETKMDQVKGYGRQFDASLIKMEQLIEWLDDGKIDGAWRTHFFEPASAAQAAEYDYTAKITGVIAKLVQNVPKDIRSRMEEAVSIPGIDRKLTRRDLLGVALNTGNSSNYNKMLKGMGWSEEQVTAMKNELTKEEWQFVQGVWDTLESMWPEIAKLQKDLTGLEPDKIEVSPVQTRHGEFKGGYYPMMYDPTASVTGQIQLSTKIGNLTEDGYTRATTPKGHTKSRESAFSAPLDLDLDNLPSHVAGVVKDLTHRKWLIDANKIVSDREIRAEIADHLGPEYVPLFTDWVKQVASDKNHNSLASLSIWRRMVTHFRYNTMITAMGFKASTILSQAAGIGPSIEVVGGKEGDGKKYITRGMARFLRAPKTSYELVTEKSGEMRHRLETRDRDLRDKFRLLEGKTDLLSEIQTFAMNGIGFADMAVSVPTWLAAYEKALEQGYEEKDAIKSGDRAVRLSQGAGGAKDLAAVMSKNNEFMRVVTMFYTPFSALYSRLRNIGHEFGGVKDVPQAASRAFWVWIFAATVAEILTGKGPEDDDPEEWAAWALKNSALYPFATVPVLRDAVNGIASEFGYTPSPIVQVGKATEKAAKTAMKVAAGRKELEDLSADTLKAASYWFGLPTKQLEITGGYLVDLTTGKENPEDLGEFASKILFRRDQKK